MRIEQGQNLVYISRQIGHSNVATTLNVYSHLMKVVNREEALKLNRALGFSVEQNGSRESVRYRPDRCKKRGCRKPATP